MSKKWQQTDTAVDGTPLMLEDGKYYSQHAWDHFGDAYRGEVRARHHGLKFERWYDGFLAGRDEDTAETPRLRGADADSNWWHTPENAAWLASDEDTAEMEPFTFDLSDDAASKLLALVRDDPVTPEQVKKMREKVDAEVARRSAAFDAWFFDKK